MKITFFKGTIFFALLLIMSCQNPDNSKQASTEQKEISSGEKGTIRKEISGRIDEIIKGVEELNVDAALKPYSNDIDFKIVNPDASVSDYQAMKNEQIVFFKTVSKMSFTTIKEDFHFLSKNIVICTWTGSNEFELKTGEKMKIDPYVGTMLFRKKNKEWKIIYAHESAAAPVAIK